MQWREGREGGSWSACTRIATGIGVLAVLLAGPGPLWGQQSGTVAGTVLDARTLRPLSGAQVVVEGTTTGVVADAAGRFQLTGLGNGSTTLRITILGYRPFSQTVAVGRTDLRLLLTETAIDLDEIVVTGTPGGTQRRAIGNAVAAVSASQLATVAPVSNVQQLLGSRVPGVVVLPGSGNLGTGGVTRVRGISTLSLTAEPLIYLDGVRIDNNPRTGPSIRGGRQVSRINDINPEDIERIEVIKGPAAATLYGTEASNGVIQIFTKQGVSGRTTFDATIKQGANWFMNPDDRLPTLWGRDATGQLVSVDLLAEEKKAGREVFQNGPVQTYGLSVRGGTDVVRFYAGGELDREEGVVSYNWQKRQSARGRIEVLANERLDFSTTFGVVRNTQRLMQAAETWDLMAQFVWGSPARVSTATRGFLRAPPEAVATIESIGDIDRMTLGVQATYRTFPWLTQRITAGADVGNETNSILFPRHPQGNLFFFGGQSLGEKSIERRRTTFTTVDYAATASVDATPDVNLTTAVGFQHYSKQFETASARGRVFPAPGVETVGGAAVTFGSEDFIENKTLGLFVQEQLGWKRRVFLTGALRGDDNSAFGENFDVIIYPKLSASWVMNEEPFWRWDAVNSLKLRAAWGQAGQQPDVFAAAQLYEPTTGPGDASTLTPQNFGNPDLKPEVGEELEIGFDAGLFDDRLSVSLTHYRHITKDAIVQRAVAPSSGFPGSQFVNVGELKNTGFEVAVGIQPIETPRFGAQLDVTLATNKSEVVSLGGVPPIIFGRQRHQEGYPIGGFFHRVVVSSTIAPNGTVTNVMCRGGEDPAAAPVPCATAPGIYTGRATPAWEGSVSATLTFLENLRLYAFVDYRGGFNIENGDIGASHALIRNTRAVHEAQDPILMGYAQLGDWQRAGFMDAGFAKLREISATYTLPSSLIGRVGARSASISVAGRNLGWLWRATDEIWGVKVIDPEIRLTSSEQSGFVQTVMPQYAQFVTTLRVSF